MPDQINNNLHRRVQEDLVSLGVERFVEGGETGLIRWAREHAVQLAVCGFVIGYLLGASRAHSLEAL